MTRTWLRRAAGTHQTLALAILFTLGGLARGSILTFEIYDAGLNDPGFPASSFNDPNIPAGFGYPEGFPIFQEYGDGIGGATQTPFAGVEFHYGEGGEGYTPNVSASYGPFSIFTGGPVAWRYGHGDLELVLRQGSQYPPMGPQIGTDYNILDIVLFADPGYDVVLYDFDLGSGIVDRTINSVKVYPGFPFPFLTPNNELYDSGSLLVEGDADAHTHVAPLDEFGELIKSQVIWIRIDANNLGAESELIAIDNLRFGQEVNLDNVDTIDPADIDEAFQSGEVPEAASLAVWLIGGGGAALTCVWRRRRGA